MTDAIPFFSIIIPTYNRAGLLKHTIESVLGQTFDNWELIITDDASTDNTRELIASYKDTKIIYLKNEKNQERGFSRNRGIERASGLYICFLDSDDLYEPDHLSCFYHFLQERSNPVALAFCNTWLLDEKNEKIQKKVPEFKDPFTYLLRYTFNPTRVCVHSDILKIFRFDPTIPGLEDLDLWLRIATTFPIFQTADYTAIYKIHENSYTSGDKVRFEKEVRNFNIIFRKPILQNLLPERETDRLLSMCYFHLSEIHEKENRKLLMYKDIFYSWFLCPEGYNLRTNRILFVRFLYSLPVFGFILKFIYKKMKP